VGINAHGNITTISTSACWTLSPAGSSTQKCVSQQSLLSKKLGVRHCQYIQGAHVPFGLYSRNQNRTALDGRMRILNAVFGISCIDPIQRWTTSGLRKSMTLIASREYS
jgi:hypothetical protein